MEQEPISLYYITINTLENAKKLAHHLVSNKFAACCNLQEGITSIYSWKGKMEEDKEILMLVKSRASLLSEIIEEVKKSHPYEVPEIIQTPILGGNPDYIKWVLENTKQPGFK